MKHQRLLREKVFLKNSTPDFQVTINKCFSNKEKKLNYAENSFHFSIPSLPPHIPHKIFTFCHYTYGPVFLTLSRASSFSKELQMTFLLASDIKNPECEFRLPPDHTLCIPCIFSNVPIPLSVWLHFGTLYSKLSSEGCTLFKPTVAVFF